ncbi:MAG TPA: hypothetical protein VMD57_05290 [Candidatus Baltobacteraceae bacterium]|nr:hypothetical protein [Candidatus Baltobacteraceae bacterium]
MKILKILTGVAAVAVAFVRANPAFCQIVTTPQVTSPLTLTVSGTVQYQKVYGLGEASTTAAHSFNEKTVYLLVSNYVANAPSYSYTNIAGTNLPANGSIAFNPNRNSFYVTNQAGFYYPLSGFDANNQYYSWIELDSIVLADDEGHYLSFGIAYKSTSQLFNPVADANMNSKGIGFTTATATAVLYIHDDPYNYDDADNPFVFWENFNPWEGGPFGGSDDEIGQNRSMIEIRGVLTSRLRLKVIAPPEEIDNANLSLSGAGNFYEYDIYDLDGVLTSGHAALVQ